MGREARAAARLRHPGIVTVHDRVTGDDGRPWIVMAAGSGLDLSSDDNATLFAPLMLMGLIWVGVQPFIWSSKVRAEFSHR